MTAYDRPATFVEDDQAEVQALTLDEVRETVAQYLDEDDMIYVIVGDKATQLEEVRRWGKGEVVELDKDGGRL